MLAPILMKLANEYQGKFILAKVNTDEERQIALQYNIRSLPTVKLFRNGTVVDEFMGAQPEGAIRGFLDRYVEKESDQIRAKAMAAHLRGDTAQAVALLQKALASDPENDRIHLDLAQLQLAQGQADEAESTLKALPNVRQLDPDVAKLLAKINFTRMAMTAPPMDKLEQIIQAEPGNCDARYQLSARKALEGDYEGAMHHLLEILRRDRSYGDDAGRKGLLSVFDLLGGSGPLVNRYRALMSSAMH
jgi:putative thioredoxin